MEPVKLFIADIPFCEILEKLGKFLADSIWAERKIEIRCNIPGVKIVKIESEQSKNIASTEEFLSNLEFLKDKSYLNKISVSVQFDNVTFFQITPNTSFGYAFVIGATDNTSDTRLNQTIKDYKLNTIDSLHKHFNFIGEFQLTKNYLSEIEQKLLYERENTLSALQQASKNLNLSATEQIGKWNDKIIELQEKLEENYLDKEKKLDETIHKKEADLDNREKKFREEKAKFDQRENTVVRRSLLNDIKDIIKQNSEAKVSNETLLKRRPILVICATVMGISLAGIVLFIYLSIAKNDNSFLFVTGSCTLGFLSTFIYYIRWQNQWFKRHADSEFANKKFESDMLRASWIVEMLLEWNDKKENPIPDHLLLSLTRNLFEKENTLPQVTHPVEDILNLRVPSS